MKLITDSQQDKGTRGGSPLPFNEELNITIEFSVFELL